MVSGNALASGRPYPTCFGYNSRGNMAPFSGAMNLFLTVTFAIIIATNKLIRQESVFDASFQSDDKVLLILLLMLFIDAFGYYSHLLPLGSSMLHAAFLNYLFYIISRSYTLLLQSISNLACANTSPEHIYHHHDRPLFTGNAGGRFTAYGSRYSRFQLAFIGDLCSSASLHLC